MFIFVWCRTGKDLVLALLCIKKKKKEAAMRHYVLSLAGASLILAPAAEAQAIQRGMDSPVLLIMLALVLLALIVVIVVTMRNRSALTRASDARFDELSGEVALLREKIDPVLPEGSNDSLEHWMARLQSDHAGLMGAANKLRKKLDSTATKLRETITELEKERELRKAAEGVLVSAQEHLRAEQGAHAETRARLTQERDELQTELGEMLSEHFATDRIAKRVVEHHPGIDGKRAAAH
jgi:hypothetical protein